MTNLKIKLFKALMSAFPNRSKLALLLGQRFGVDYEVLTPLSTIDVEYWTIVEQVEAEGWLEELARAAYETVPRNQLLSELILQTDMTSANGMLAPADMVPAKIGPALERMVRDRSSLSDVPTFLARLQALEAQVCRIEGPGPKALGTGFLVAPDLIMTNHHVVADLLPATGPVPLHCRFDYLTDTEGIEVRAGELVPFATDWLVAAQPHDPSDISLVDDDEPAPDALDFALIRLAVPVGDNARKGDVTPDNPPRGWIGIDRTRRLQVDEDIFILQHPEGKPLKLGLGRVTAVFAGGLRLRHDVTTEPGSSGSPVLTRGLELSALHHVGDPNSFRNALFNQAIPFANIIDFLDGKVDPFWEVSS